MKTSIKKSRDLRECQCDTCGSNFAVNYDAANDEYICDECHANETEDDSDDFEELEETKEEQHIRREGKL